MAVALQERMQEIPDVGVYPLIRADPFPPFPEVVVVGLEVIERHQGRQDVHLVPLGHIKEAPKVVPVGRRGARDMPIPVDFDPDVSAARDPDPRGIDSAIVEQLKVGVPPVRVEITSQVVPMMPRGVGPIYPDSARSQP